MEIKVQITVKSEVGQPEVVRALSVDRYGPRRSGSRWPKPARFGWAGENDGRTASRGVRRARAALSPLWPGARVQRAPPNRVSYPVWQTTTG